MVAVSPNYFRDVGREVVLAVGVGYGSSQQCGSIDGVQADRHTGDGSFTCVLDSVSVGVEPDTIPDL